jgi:zinc protease
MRRLCLASCLMTALSAAPGVAQQAPDRSVAPKPGPAPSLKLPAIDQRKLANGLPVWIVEMHEVPVVQAALVVQSGSSAETAAAKYGVASLTAAMLDEGAGSRGALEIADAIDLLGASLVTGSSYDSSFVRLGVPVARFDQALPIMADVALRPAFASEAFPRLLFGADNRYGVPEVGTPASLQALSVDDLKAFHSAYFRPDNAVLLVVGDVKPDTLLPALEAAFGSWTASGPPPARATVAPVKQPAARKVFLVDKPGAAQSQIRIGWVGVPRLTPDYFPLTMMNTILGGSFTSRLNQNLRERNGYAYGAGSTFAMRREAGPFFAAAGVQTDKTSEALREFFNEFDGMLKPVPADEFQKAQNYIALGFPGDFETTGDLLGRLQELQVFGLPVDYFGGYVSRVMAVTPAELQTIAAQYIKPSHFVVVVVGDGSKVESGIRALNLGPLTTLSIDEALGPGPKP